MSSQSPDPKPSFLKRIASVGRVVWPAAIVFLALDLSVDPEVSLLRSTSGGDTSAAEDLRIAPLDGMQTALPAMELQDESSAQDHVWFGVEETVEALSTSSQEALPTLSGGWAGQFASILDGDSDSECWSTYEVNLRISDHDGEIGGPGSYVADPAACSSLDRPVVAFFNASGERSGNQVSLVITDDASDATTMLFNGVVAGESIVGAFSMPNGAPASGTVVLRPSDTQS